MKIKTPQGKKWYFPALAFAIPFIGMLAVMLISGYKPFGTYSMLYSDMYHQYYPFFVAYRKALLSGESLLYSWNVGMGMDYLGLISYYLASPLNLLSVLVPEQFTLEYFSLLMPIKLGLASLFFALFLKKLFDRNDLSIALFGSFYGLCAWALGYQWNIMWLDTFALLPLVALGTVSLLRDKKFLLYTLSLFFSVFINYYIGFFTCIFVALIFFCYEICRFRGFKRFFADLLRIALFSALAIGMTAMLSLPTLAALKNTQSSVNQFPTGFKMNIASENTWQGLLDAMRQVAGNMAGGLEPTFKEGLPNLYCGVGSVLFAVLFLTSKDTSLRDKICSVFMLVFMMLSFILRQLDYIWHGFHFTNMIPYRFSFLFSFVVLYMAYRAYLESSRFRMWQILLSLVAAGGLIACSDSRTDPIFLAYNGGFLLLYLAALLCGQVFHRLPADATEEEAAEMNLTRQTRARRMSLILSAVMALEIILNLVSFGIHFPGTNVSNYPRGTTHSASMIRYMHEREKDSPFYRAEVTHSQTLNDGALNGYDGISTFTSSANVRVTQFMKALGYAAKNTYNRYCWEESSPVSNLFLNLKYMIERDGHGPGSSYFDEIHHYGTVYLYRSNAYLPLGFLADSELAELSFEGTGNPFRFQNSLFRAATGTTGSVFLSVPEENTEVTISSGSFTNGPKNGYCAYKTDALAGTITYTFTADRDGFACVSLDVSQRNSITILKNGMELYSETMGLPQMLAVSDVTAGDTFAVRISCKSSESGSMNVFAAILDDRLFREGYDFLNSSTLELTEFSTTLVEGTITCTRDGLLYTSIPQDGNWSATVDGKDAQIQLVGDVMIGLDLTEGTHTVRFTYRNAAFSLGWKITALCAGILIAIAVIRALPPKKRGKFEKV